MNENDKKEASPAGQSIAPFTAVLAEGELSMSTPAITLRTLIEGPVTKHKSVTGWVRQRGVAKPVHTLWRYLPELDRYLYPITKDRLKAGARRIGLDTVALHTIDSDHREWLLIEWETGCLALRLRRPEDVADVLSPDRYARRSGPDASRARP
jgi:hypothetical protein